MKKILLSTVIASVSAAAASQAFAAEDLASAFKEGKTEVSFRLRNETVDVDNAKKDVDATTLKSRITYTTGDLMGFSAVAEVDSVSELFETNYNDGVNNKTAYNNVLDHEYTDFNQVYLAYKGFGSVFKLGNQRILLDNQRHIGGVGFRQDEQTFDAFSVTNTSLPDTTIFVAAINNVHDIKGNNTLEDDTLVNVKYAASKAATVSGYAYLLANIAGVDYTTYGLRVVGDTEVVVYEAEYATQKKETAAADFDTSYYNLIVGAKFAGFTAKIGQESLGSDDGAAAFATPLGTNHAFLGWSDTWLQAGNKGLVDTNLSLAGDVAGVKVVAQYHSFATDKDGDDMGTELGLMLSKQFGAYGLEAKMADYKASDEAEAIPAPNAKKDTQKVWLTATAKF